jgi:hypothetical protein
LAKKREKPLDLLRFSSEIKENHHSPNKCNTIINIQDHSSPSPAEENHPVKQWLIERLKDKLQVASRSSMHSHKPLLLYRRIIEESQNALEEEIAYISRNNIVRIEYAYGGFIPTTFKTIEVFTFEKFTKWITQRNKKDLLLQCIEELEQ